jgi:GNAT superfamily N-acetyltransferase
MLVYPLPETPISVSLPPEVRISLAGPADADLWIITTAQGFTEQEQPSEIDLEILGPNFHSANAACFLAWVGNRPAGGGGMYTHAGVTELGGASTRPAFRKRGIQTALLFARLAAAQELGCDLAISLTEPGSASQRNLERLGFGLAYTKVTMVAPA